MARALRVEFEGAYYHVMNRGRSQISIFHDEQDKKRFLNIVNESCKLYHVEICAYCLMGNHYHMLAHTPDANLSSFMRQVNGVYTQIYNRKYKKDGTLFRGRYKAIVVQEEFYLLRVIRYIHRNPFKTDLIKKKGGYTLSSHQYYLEWKEEQWLKYKHILEKLWGKTALNRYKEFIKKEDDKELEEYYNKKARGWILGETDYVDNIKQKYIHNRRYDREIPQRRMLENQRKAENIEKETMKYFNIGIDGLRKSARGKENIVRMLAICLSRDLTGMTHRDIAQRYGLGSYKTVNKYCERVRKRKSVDNTFNRIFEGLSKRCSQVET